MLFIAVAAGCLLVIGALSFLRVKYLQNVLYMSDHAVRSEAVVSRELFKMLLWISVVGFLCLIIGITKMGLIK
jgi:nitric oxide reductase large subunit